ncbi:hypothetical protein ABT187_33970 [Streptomyces sp. NPDC001817]|uniref:hypothetical protein n=1 Tax=Streptomyces sp. NPDC001817 TaxID=3154398 RepID=UPI00333045DE
MSDDLTAHELATALHELATANETQPPVSAAGIRRRAVRRSRRRRTTLALGAGATALALAAFAVSLKTGGTPAHRQPPAATAPRLPSPAPSASPSPSSSFPGPPPSATPTGIAIAGTVNLGKQTLTIDGRVMPITYGFPTLVAAGPLTVAAKLDLGRGSVGQLPEASCKVAEPYAVELRDTDRNSIYVGSLACSARTGSWIGLDPKDAVWLYNRLTPGDTLSAVTPKA